MQRQIAFIIEIDKLKNILRQSLVTGGRRRENDAEHSWHLAMMAIVLAEYANEPELDLVRVVQMVLVHDLVEIDAGDTFAYDEKGHEDKSEREQKAADRLFSLLPGDQGRQVMRLWQEFEERRSAEARFAAALDRLQPMLLNYYTEGESWRKHGISRGQVESRNRHIAEGSETLWAYAKRLIEDAVRSGYLLP